MRAGATGRVRVCGARILVGSSIGKLAKEPSGNAALLATPEELTAARFEMVVQRLADDLTYGTDDSRFVGSGIEYAQSRPFVWGDSVRAIDWRVTGRTGRTHVKEYVATKRTPVWIVVDTSASMRASSTSISKHAVATWAGAVLALVALARQSPAGVIGTGGEGLDTASGHSSARGRVWRGVHAVRLSRTTRAHGTRELLDLTLAEVDRRSSSASLVIVLSDLREERAVEAIQRTAMRHDCVVGHLVDPAEFGLHAPGYLRAREAETGAATVSSGKARRTFDEECSAIRAAVIGAGGAGGAVYALLRTDRPLVPEMRRLIERNALAGGGR